MSAESIAQVFAQLDPPLWLLTAAAEARRSGLIATFVNQASIVAELPRVVVGIARQHFTWELIEASGTFALHLLGPEHLEWAWRFGLQTGRATDKLEGLDWRHDATGAPVLVNALGWLSCRVENRLDTGDRTVYLAEVLDGELTRAAPILTLKRTLQMAPTEMLRQLQQRMAYDSKVDAAAIRAWRGSV